MVDKKSTYTLQDLEEILNVPEKQLLNIIHNAGITECARIAGYRMYTPEQVGQLKKEVYHPKNY